MVSDRSGGGFYDEETTSQYLAHRHSGTSSPNVVMEEPAVLEHLGTVAGLRVLDLGCGDGSFATTVLAMGATSYLGIDGSPAMIDAARRTTTDARASFEVGSMERLELVPGSADVVTSRMALHYLASLDGVLTSARLALGDSGRLLFSVVHPIITSHDNESPGPRGSWTVDRYFEPGERRREWFGKEVTWHHRTLEAYVSAVLDAGFALTAISECEPSAALLANEPDELARRRRVPLMLLLAAHIGR